MSRFELICRKTFAPLSTKRNVIVLITKNFSSLLTRANFHSFNCTFVDTLQTGGRAFNGCVCACVRARMMRSW